MDTGFSCNYRKRASYDQMPGLHSHAGVCEFYFLSSGERRYFIQDSVVQVYAKSFVFIKPGLLHKTSYLGGGGHSRYHATVPAGWLDGIIDSLPPFFVCHHQEVLEALFADLLLESRGTDCFSMAFCQALSVEILVKAYRSYQDSMSPRDDFLDRVSAYVRRNLTGEVGLDAVSCQMNLSASYFSTLFHRRSGMRYSDFVRSMRISVAVDALERGCSVRQASALAGFSDPGYFKDVLSPEGRRLSQSGALTAFFR